MLEKEELGEEWDGSQEEGNHTHSGVKARFVVSTKKPKSSKQEERGEVQSKKQSAHWHFIYFYLGKRGVGGGLGLPGWPNSCSCYKGSGCLGEEGTRIGELACFLPPLEALGFWRREPETVSTRETEIFPSAAEKETSLQGHKIYGSPDLEISRRPPCPHCLLAYLACFGLFKCRWRQRNCKADGGRGEERQRLYQ